MMMMMNASNRAPTACASLIAALVLAVAACGSDAPPTATPQTTPALDSSTPALDSSAPAPAPDATAPEPDTTDPGAPSSEPAPDGSSGTRGVEVSVTASGAGGCVDAVETSSLEITGGTADDVWATFELVLGNNCGDPDRFVVFERPADVPGIAGWRRDVAGGDVTLEGPVCDDRVDCAEETRSVALAGAVDHVVGFELRRNVSDESLVAGSPYDVPVAAIYDYATDLLDDDPIEIVVTIAVGEPSAVPAGDTTPIATGDRPVTVLAAGFDLLTFPATAFADAPGDLTDTFEVLERSVAEQVDVDALGVDWQRDAVIVFSIPTDLCPPVLAGLDIADGVATPMFENPGYLGCEEPQLSHTVIAAVDREVLADVSEIRLPPDDPYFDVSATAVVDATPASATEPAPEPMPLPEFGTTSGVGPLPGPGEVEVVELDSGAPVYVVAHRDGSVSALDPRAGSPLEAPDGIFGLVRWNAANRNFMGRGVWDEYGRRVDGFRSSDMIGRATRVVERNGEPIVEIGDVVAGPAGSPIASTEDARAMTDAVIDLGSPISLEDALAAPAGSTVVMDAAIVIDPVGAFVCSGQEPGLGTPCPAGSPTLDGGSAVDGFRSVYFGPLIGTRSATGFDRVASTGGTASESL